MISYQSQEKPTVVSAYDFIVVGAGSSGSVTPTPVDDMFHFLTPALPVVPVVPMMNWVCHTYVDL